jgi:hypothetical protein
VGDRISKSVGAIPFRRPILFAHDDVADINAEYVWVSGSTVHQSFESDEL